MLHLRLFQSRSTCLLTRRLHLSTITRHSKTVHDNSSRFGNVDRNPCEEQLVIQIESLCREGYLDMAVHKISHMDDIGFRPENNNSYFILMNACIKMKSLPHAKWLYCHIMKRNLDLDGLLGERLVLTLAKCGALDDALLVFNVLSCRSVISWTAIISAYTECNRALEALQLFQCMQDEHVQLNPYTYVSLIKACSSISDLEMGRQLHSDICNKGFSNPFIDSVLVTMYGKCGSILDAESAFYEHSQLNVVSWNAMLSIYTEYNHCESALLLYRQMQHEGIDGDERTFTIALQACTNAVEKKGAFNIGNRIQSMLFVEVGQALHSNARRKGFASKLYVANTLISMYGRFGKILEAENVFNCLSECNIVSWSLMLSTYVDKRNVVAMFNLYRQMQQVGLQPDERVYIILLQGCIILSESLGIVVALEIGRALHYDADRSGLSTNTFFANTLISMYGRCGSIEEAEGVFQLLPVHNLVSWNAILSAYMDQGHVQKCVKLYRQMREEGKAVDSQTYAIIFQTLLRETEAFIEQQHWLEEIIHALYSEVLRNGFLMDACLCGTIVEMYMKLGKVNIAEHAFSVLRRNDHRVLNTILLGYTRQGQNEKALQLYTSMQREDIIPCQQTFIATFRACSGLTEKEKAVELEGELIKQVSTEIAVSLHVDAREADLESDILVSNTILSTYSKCGAIQQAQRLFEVMDKHDIVSWNAMLSAYVYQKESIMALQVFQQMHEEGMVPNKVSYLFALQACGILASKEELLQQNNYINEMVLEIVRALHADVVRAFLSLDSILSNALLNAYGSSGSVEDVTNLFIGLSDSDIVSWSMILSAYLEQGSGIATLQLYAHMQKQGISPDDKMILVIFQACGTLADKCSNAITCLEIGYVLHTDTTKLGFTSSVHVLNTIISMYGKCRSILDAENMFTRMSKHDIVSWNVMLSVYLDHGQVENVMTLYKEMLELGINPDKQTFMIVLRACSAAAKETKNDTMFPCLAPIKLCHVLHFDALRRGLAEDCWVGSSLVNAYVHSGCAIEGENVFVRLPNPKITAWNALLGAYVKNGDWDKASRVFKCIIGGQIILDHSSLFNLLLASNELGNIELCWKLHYIIVSTECDIDPLLKASLIHAYGNVSSLSDSWAAFHELPQPDAVSWTSCIAGHAVSGDCLSSLTLFKSMIMELDNPNEITFLSLLSACNHDGFVDIALTFFDSMQIKFNINPDLKHYAALTETLGRAGDFMRLENVLQNMQVDADLAIWLSLLGACQKHNNLEVAKIAFDKILCSHHLDVAAHVLMSNIFSETASE